MPERLPTVSNSTVIIALSQIGYLIILKDLYKKVILPEGVFRELHAGHPKSGSDISDESWIEIRRVSNIRLLEYLSISLDKGESEAIVLAEELPAGLLLMDDYWGRKIAAKRKIPVAGTLGILIKAKQTGLIKKVKPLFGKLIENGFWIDKAVLEFSLKKAGE
ncbi:MAG: DUF3368 domain-containing protein [Candidatus Wallbacteria bacterium]|nr:DUF3368 domain-containing protein [Candidatus Wallbacteria bacterium]